MVIIGVLVGIAAAVVVGPQWAPSIGWAAACATYVVTAWPLLRFDAERTARSAAREDPRRTVTDLLLVGAAIASVVALLVVLSGARGLHGPAQDLAAALGVVSVFLSWLLVQTLYTLRYAEYYYSGTPGGIDFNQPEPPRYSDFAYFAVTVGMTYQVSDTTIRSSEVRVATLRHALLSFFFGTVVIASVINLVAGLGG
ncbi:DUF1345 domain-containing protein [Curtobacterium sp. ISL-83]|nr:DUF1345 domain-containing protein [Curtobacterium sp. ISL-83]